MTHFIGAVLVPSNTEFIINGQRTAFPTLYGEDARDITAGTALNDYLDAALAKFSENIEVERWATKEDTIAAGRKAIEEYRDGTYAKFIEDPVKYAEGVSNEQHLEYLRTEFPKKLEWTDEEVYADAIKFEEPEDIREDGAVRHTYNPLSKWDWWTIGGRWEQTYRERQGEKISGLREELQKALVNLNDPEAQAELAAVEAEIKEFHNAWKQQRAITKAWFDANPDKRTDSLEQNVRLAHAEQGIEVEKVYGFEDSDAAEAKRLDCRAYLPWWFPKHIVVPVKVEQDPTATNEAVYEADGSPTLVDDFEWVERGTVGWWGSFRDESGGDIAWVERLIAALDKFEDDSRLVYIDFHI